MAPGFLHEQLPSDRVRLLALSKILPNWPENFVFPIEVDPTYKREPNTTYIYITASFLATITIATVLLRLWVRYKGTFGMDDKVMVLAFVSI